ncbi:hypothetical protein KIPB_015039, partial [Kipferlia bialata]
GGERMSRRRRSPQQRAMPAPLSFLEPNMDPVRAVVERDTSAEGVPTYHIDLPLSQMPSEGIVGVTIYDKETGAQTRVRIPIPNPRAESLIDLGDKETETEGETESIHGALKGF